MQFNLPSLLLATLFFGVTAFLTKEIAFQNEIRRSEVAQAIAEAEPDEVPNIKTICAGIPRELPVATFIIGLLTLTKYRRTAAIFSVLVAIWFADFVRVG